MEWVLQVVDEIDDVIHAARHTSSSIIDEMGVYLLAGLGLIAAIVSLPWGADPTIVGASAVTANLAVLLKIRDRRAIRARDEVRG
jgi:hypothetical protein